MKKINNARRRKTVAGVAAVVPATVPPASMLGDVVSLLKAAGLMIVPQSSPAQSPVPAVVPTPRKRYAVVKHPIPPFGESAVTLWKWLGANSPATQRELEEGTGMTEGQIKGAIRQLTLAGYVSSERTAE